MYSTGKNELQKHHDLRNVHIVYCIVKSMAKEYELEDEEIEETDEKEEMDVEVDEGEEKDNTPTCQKMMVALWVKKKSNKYIDEFLDFMESLGFQYVDHKIPEDKNLKNKVLILFFYYNSCRIVEINGIERPLSIDGAILSFIESYYPNFIYDYHNINPRCDYVKTRNKKMKLDDEKNNEK